MTRQLPLAIQLKPDISFDTFVPGRNAEIVNTLRQITEQGSEQFFSLWGPKGVGKTHLLQAACVQATGRDQTVAYIPLTQANDLTPAITEDLDRLQLICVDDLQAVCSHTAWERALFNLFNRIREKGGRLLISADTSLAHLAISLADLRSRLTWGPSYQLQSLDDNDRLTLLIQSARRRGLDLNRESALYVLRRCPRDTHALQDLLEHLDRYSMARQRRLTIPFVREALRTLVLRNQS